MNTKFVHFMGWQKRIIGKNHYLTTCQGGGGNMKKYKILWGNTPKFRSFVVVTAIFRNRREGVLNKYKGWSFYGLENLE